MLTIITVYRAKDGNISVAVVDGRLDDKQRQAWRDAYGCDQPENDDCDNHQDNMFFREIDAPLANNQIDDMHDADGERRR